MACILRPECNFLNGYFRCLLPLETVVVEVKAKMMRGIHTFKRDRTTKVISCNPSSTRLHPYPSLIQKMKSYLQLECKLSPKPNHNHAPALLPKRTIPQSERPQDPKWLKRRGKPEYLQKEGTRCG